MSREQNSVPLVSVVIASYNAAQTLPDTLESVFAQSYKNLEVIVVDDGSTDDTSAVLAQQFPQVSCIRKTNGGLPSARNCGCLAANGEFVALMDADDICHPDRISVQVALMKAQPDLLLCSSEFSAFDATGPIKQRFAKYYYSQIAEAPGGIGSFFGGRALLDLKAAGAITHSADNQIPIYFGNCYENLAHGNFIHPPTVLFRREVIEKFGRFDETIRNMCDWEWLARVARFGNFGYIDVPLLDYRLSENQLSGSGNCLQASLDILKIRESVALRNPELRLRSGSDLERLIGLSAVTAADLWIDVDKMTTIRLLVKAFRYGAFSGFWCKVVGKLLLPRTVLCQLRSVRLRQRAV